MFGEGAFLTKRGDLSQPGQFASEQMVILASPQARIDNVRVLGPFRESTQVELSQSDAVLLGLNPPVRDSGKHDGTPGITIIGPKGKVDIEKGVIIAQRHIHMTPADAREYGVMDKDIVWVTISNEGKGIDAESSNRSTIFGDVIIRINPEYKLDFHLDTDEANAAGVFLGEKSFGHIVKEGMDKEDKNADGYYERKKVYSEWDVRQAREAGLKIKVEKGTILTPSARDYGKKWDIFTYS